MKIEQAYSCRGSDNAVMPCHKLAISIMGFRAALSQYCAR